MSQRLCTLHTAHTMHEEERTEATFKERTKTKYATLQGEKAPILKLFHKFNRHLSYKQLYIKDGGHLFLLC